MNTTNMKTKKFYAMLWHLGQAYSANTGKRYCVTYYSFNTKAERDAFCQDGGSFKTSTGWREPICSNDSELKKAVKNEEIIAC